MNFEDSISSLQKPRQNVEHCRWYFIVPWVTNPFFSTLTLYEGVHHGFDERFAAIEIAFSQLDKMLEHNLFALFLSHVNHLETGLVRVTLAKEF